MALHWKWLKPRPEYGLDWRVCSELLAGAFTTGGSYTSIDLTLNKVLLSVCCQQEYFAKVNCPDNQSRKSIRFFDSYHCLAGNLLPMISPLTSGQISWPAGGGAVPCHSRLQDTPFQK